MHAPAGRKGSDIAEGGSNRFVRDPGLPTRYRDLLHPWVVANLGNVVGTGAGIVHGFELVEGDAF